MNVCHANLLLLRLQEFTTTSGLQRTSLWMLTHTADARKWGRVMYHTPGVLSTGPCPEIRQHLAEFLFRTTLDEEEVDLQEEPSDD